MDDGQNKIRPDYHAFRGGIEATTGMALLSRLTTLGGANLAIAGAILALAWIAFGSLRIGGWPGVTGALLIAVMLTWLAAYAIGKHANATKTDARRAPPAQPESD